MSGKRVLVACIGNIFLGDDAFGCEVARYLSGRELPAGVELVDFGIRGYDLAYALMDGYETTIIVDAVPRGGEPGTIYVIEPDQGEIDELGKSEVSVEPHSMDPMKVLAMVRAMGGIPGHIVLVGCEPVFTGGADGFMGLSDAVAASVEKAADVVESIAAEKLTGSYTYAA